ncbi:unnamed protein product [marine sediment metagenome]|uniref:Uncharacterized protein n=1 Tax=marine sediment metagenome TaxID=412755 RepID=X0WGQ6_9ZZZZ
MDEPQERNRGPREHCCPRSTKARLPVRHGAHDGTTSTSTTITSSAKHRQAVPMTFRAVTGASTSSGSSK